MLEADGEILQIKKSLDAKSDLLGQGNSFMMRKFLKTALAV